MLPVSPSRPPAEARPSRPARRELLRCLGFGAALPVVLGACSSGGGPEVYTTTIAESKRDVERALVDSGTPSISVALFDRECVIWAQAFGTIDKASGAAPTTDTLFCIGSCSKMFATVAVMLLVERGKVALDAPYVRYVPAFRMASPEYTLITLRMLLNHASGLPGSDYRNCFASAPVPGYLAQVMRTLTNSRLKHLPGEMSVYCNDGFTLVEALVEAVDGRTYDRFVADEILAPLGMSRSRFANEAFAEGSFAPAYDDDRKLGQEFVGPHASGGLYTTPTEMARFGRMLLGGGLIDGMRLLSRESIAEMATDQCIGQPIRPVAMTDGFGLGWDGVREGGLAAVGVTAWHKAGGTSQYTSEFFVLPDAGLGLMVSGTASGYGANGLAERILRRALLERGAIAALPGPLPERPAESRSPTPAELAAIEGYYAHYQGLVRVQAAGDGTIAISSLRQDAWAAEVPGFRLRVGGAFARDAASNVAYGVARSQGRRYLVVDAPYGNGDWIFRFPYAERITPGAPLSAAWRARVGRDWLAVNELPQSLGIDLGGPRLTIREAPGLPGYVMVGAGSVGVDPQPLDASQSDTEARMFMKLPAFQGRDLYDLRVLPRGAEEWVVLADAVFRPADSVVPLGDASEIVTIGAEGWSEWRRLGPGAIRTISGATAWRLFDDAFAQTDAGGATGATVRASERGGFVLFYGAPGDRIAVRP